MKILTFDIGGANIKKLLAEYKNGELEIIKNEIHYFPFWNKKTNLKPFLSNLDEDSDSVAITITAELSDAFTSKKEGIKYIIKKCKEIFKNPYFCSIEQKLIPAGDITSPEEIAAANYAASCYYLQKEFQEGILVDMGSTTTDIIPFHKDKILYKRSDFERLKAGQLYYTGFLRTPVNTLISDIEIDGKEIPLASEYFAITADVYNVLGYNFQYSCNTPDDGDKDIKSSYKRIGRLLCADHEEVGVDNCRKIAKEAEDVQREKVSKRISNIARKYNMKDVYISGIGIEVLKRAAERLNLKTVNLTKFTPAYNNLPCLGLTYITIENRRKE